MAKVISVHSFRRGTGKSCIAINLATLLAMSGACIGVIDLNVQSPNIYTPFNLTGNHAKWFLNDYLVGNCSIDQAIYDVTPELGAGAEGHLYVMPSNAVVSAITRATYEKYDITKLNDGLHQIIKVKDLDILVLDTGSGINESTLTAIAFSDVLAIIIRPDKQDYQGTAVTVDIAHKLDIPSVLLVANMVPNTYDDENVRLEVEKAYQCQVAAVLPYTNEIMIAQAGAKIFVTQFPEHPVTKNFKQLASCLVEQ